MIDVDALEDQLEQALAANLGLIPGAKAARAAPPPLPRLSQPEPFRAPSRSAEHLRRADDEEVSGAAHRLDGDASATVRALLEGRVDDARKGMDDELRRRREARDPEAEARHLGQRFRLVLEWGDEDEQYALLDACRSRAYTYGELRWSGALTLLLVQLGRRDEALRELEATVSECQGLTRDACWLDIVTDLAEAAFLLGDVEGARILREWLAEVPDRLVTGRGDVCKGSLHRFQAHVAAVLGAWAEADRAFRAAADAHRALGAPVLLARTLQQWGRSLAGRDDLFARRCLQESEDLAQELGLRYGRGARPGDPVAVSTPA